MNITPPIRSPPTWVTYWAIGPAIRKRSSNLRSRWTCFEELPAKKRYLLTLNQCLIRNLALRMNQMMKNTWSHCLPSWKKTAISRMIVSTMRLLRSWNLLRKCLKNRSRFLLLKKVTMNLCISARVLIIQTLMTRWERDGKWAWRISLHRTLKSVWANWSLPLPRLTLLMKSWIPIHTSVI